MVDYRMEAPPVLRDFLVYHETIQGHARRTVDEYFLDLRNFFRFLKLDKGLAAPNTPLDQISIDDVDLDLVRSVTLSDVYAYMNYLSRDRVVHPNSSDEHHGLAASARARKVAAIRKAVRINAPDASDAVDVLAKVGGLDIAGLTGVFLGGAICHIPIVIDGFISAAAALCAARIAPDCADYMMPSHRSNEPAGGMVLEALGLSPFIDCGMSLGEGSGAVAVLPLLEMGLEVYNRMSTFEEIKVEQYEELK